MKYPIITDTIIDVTKAPYFADNTGKTDCTAVLRQIFDDILQREIDGVKETYARLREMSENGTKNIYDGFENRDDWQGVNVIYPQYVPDERIIYFPAGTYLVSDTITYTLKDLQNILYSKPYAELCRGIHIMGESKESVTIRLSDNSVGFEEGTRKPLISFIQRDDYDKKEGTNVAQGNSIEDITLDCGSGNDGVVGIRFQACNSGRIQNVTIKTEKGYCGIANGISAEASICDVVCNGFEYGVVAVGSSILALNDLDLSSNTVAAIFSNGGRIVSQNIKHGEIPLYEFGEGKRGIHYIVDEPDVQLGDLKGNSVYIEKNPSLLRKSRIPKNPRSMSAEDWALVDDFGAVGDGKTDSTAAIQAAMNSGKKVIMFGSGHYLVSGEITIPKTVQTVDFMFCDFFSADELVNARGGALFNINEDSDEMLFMENVYTFEQFYGHLRFIKHAAKRDLVMSDIHNQASATYFNTVPGSKVYMDNCASTVGTYSCNAILERPGLPPYFSYVIPYEFHGQTVYGRQINPERADVEMLNDNSNILMDGFKVEGPGAVVKNIRGGNTELNLVTCGIGYRNAPNALFQTEYARTKVVGCRIGGCGDKLNYVWIIEQNIDGLVEFVHNNEVPDRLSESCCHINYYDSNELENLQ